ncbi:MAG: thioredoxin family protein [Proteobacteria bacterium]|nr:thioredoxin family protein [Pseudomonadota bacterium]
MISRRLFNHWAAVGVLSGAGGLLAGAGTVRIATAAEAPRLTRDGMYTEPWFLDSFLELKDDLEEARGKGKNFAVIWELDGCPYCRETHLVNFAVPEIRDFIKENFEILQLDVRGGRDVTDFNGKVSSERDLAKRLKVRFSPTVQFFAEDPKAAQGNTGKIVEVARMAGYFRPLHFLTMFEYVRNKGYVDGNYRNFLKAKMKALKSGKI